MQLFRFKKRHGVVTKTMYGDAANVDNDSIVDWERTTLARIHSLYRPEDIFNADEFGLFYRMKPNSTQTFKATPRSALALGKRSKERVTVLIGASAVGEKLPLNVIGKSERPRCFGRLRTLPCDYSHRAWMTRQLWRQIVEKLERRMKGEKRKIALIVDNVATHKKLSPERFEHVTVFYLPPGTTSKSQPMDAGMLISLFSDFRALFRCYTCHQIALSTEPHGTTFGYVQSWCELICVSA